MKYEQKYKLYLNGEDKEKILSFLRTNHFQDVSNPYDINYYQFKNNLMTKDTNLSLDYIRIDMRINKDSFEFSSESYGTKQHQRNCKRYLKLLFSTCYTLAKYDDYQIKNWERYHKRLKSGKALAAVVGETLIELVFEVLGSILEGLS